MVKPPTSLPNFLPQMPILSEPPKKQHQQQHHRGYCHSQGSEQSLQEVVSKTDSSLVYSPSTTTAGTTRTGLLGVQLL